MKRLGYKTRNRKTAVNGKIAVIRLRPTTFLILNSRPAFPCKNLVLATLACRIRGIWVADMRLALVWDPSAPEAGSGLLT